jgi:hypothetical protein
MNLQPMKKKGYKETMEFEERGTHGKKIEMDC